MASPLFADSENRRAKTSSSTSKARRGVGRNELLQRKTRNQKLADARTFVPDQNNKNGARTNRNMMGRGRILRNLDSSEGQSVQKMQAVATGFLIMWSTFPLYIPQVLLWIIGLGGLAAESDFLISIFVDGQGVFMLSYIVIAIIGLGSMAYAVIMFNIRGVDCFGGHKSLYFFLCLMGYFVFFINAAPWVALWVISVMLNQDNEGAEA